MPRCDLFKVDPLPQWSTAPSKSVGELKRIGLVPGTWGGRGGGGGGGGAR